MSTTLSVNDIGAANRSGRLIGTVFALMWCALGAVANTAVADEPCEPGWHALASGGQIGVNDSVRALMMLNGDLIAGGNFTTAGGQTVNHIARWDGLSGGWHPFTSGGEIGVNGNVSAITEWNGDLIAGGSFTSAGGQIVNRIARWDGSAWHPLTSGGQIGVAGGVSALTVWDGDLIAGGNFTTAGGQTVNHIARWDGDQWHQFTSGGQIGVFGITATILALTVWDGHLVAAGGFSTAGGQTVNRIARWDGSAWHPFTSGGQIGVGPLNQPAYTLAIWNDDLVVGGSFTTAGGQAVNHIARWDGSAWQPFSAGGQTGMGGDFGWVFTLTVWNDELIAGGHFTTAGGQVVNYIARWDGSAWHPFSAGGQNGLLPSVWSLTSFNDDLVVGGEFGSAGGQPVNGIAMWKVCPLQPAGACCFADGSCDETSQSQCDTRTGTYQGDGTTCAEANCKSQNSVFMILARIDNVHLPQHQFMLEFDIELAGEIDDVLLVPPGGPAIWLDTDDPPDGFWFGGFFFESFNEMQDFADGTWLITVFGSKGSNSTSTFAFEAAAIAESDLFPTPTILSPSQGETGVSPCPTFSWKDPTGKVEPHALGVGIQHESESDEQVVVSIFGTIDLDATTWQPPLPLAPGTNEFEVTYALFDDGPVGPLTVVSGSIEWGGWSFAPPDYPESTPLLLIGSARVITFHVAGDCAPDCAFADLNCDGSVGVADLLILLANWGECADCTPGNCPADLTGSCSVGVADLLILLANWG